MQAKLALLEDHPFSLTLGTQHPIVLEQTVATGDVIKQIQQIYEQQNAADELRQLLKERSV